MRRSEALGVKNVQIVDAFDTKKLENVIKEEVARDEISVIIAQSPCALLKSYVPKGKCVAIPEKCKKCGLCLASGCPAITKNEDGTISIDQTLCNGCGLCMQNCHFDAIELKKKGE